MRYIGIVLALLISVGCGAGKPQQNLHSDVSVPVVAAEIAQLVPPSVPANSTPFVLTVNGSNFGTDSVVFWNGMAQSTRVITSSQVIANITSTDLETVGLVPIYVRTQGVTSNTMDFTVTIQ